MSEELRWILIIIATILIGSWLASLNNFFLIIWVILVFVFVIWMAR